MGLCWCSHHKITKMNRVAYNKNGGRKNRGINFRAENKQIRKKTNTEKRCTYFKGLVCKQQNHKNETKSPLKAMKPSGGCLQSGSRGKSRERRKDEKKRNEQRKEERKRERKRQVANKGRDNLREKRSRRSCSRGRSGTSITRTKNEASRERQIIP